MPEIKAGELVHPISHTFTRKPGFGYWTMGMLLSGGTQWTSIRTGKIYYKKAPCLSLTPPDTPYSIKFKGKGRTWSTTWVIFDTPSIKHTLSSFGINRDDTLDLPLTTSQKTMAAGVFKQLIYYTQNAHPFAERLQVNLVEHLLLFMLGISQNLTIDRRIHDVMEILHQDLAEPLRLKDVADRAGMSVSNLSHMFKEQVGCSPMAYRERQRLNAAARQLLSTDYTIDQVAVGLGFANGFHFSRRFKMLFKKSPTAYRKGQ